MNDKLRKTSLVRIIIALLAIAPSLASGQIAPYTKAATLVTGQWPSINNKGDMVWSQLDGGYWQVWSIKDPFFSVATEVTTGNQNHERPVIDDNGDIVYFQDHSGGGLGYEVVYLSSGGAQSVLEFSSSNPSGCTPPACSSWRTAGQNFGISADGTTVTYYDFCTAGTPPSCVRRFDVSGIGTLQCSGGACDFFGYDYPTINSNGQIAFTDSNSPSDIYYTSTASPQIPGTKFASGEFPHLADAVTYGGQLNPQIAYILNSNGSNRIESNLLLNKAGQNVPVDFGEWVSVNNSGAIVYQTTGSSNSPIWFAGNTNAVDLSGVPTISWSEILTQYAPRLVIADAWGGKSKFPAHDILAGALLANPNLALAAYAVLNLNSGAPTPAQQMKNAIAAVGTLAPQLKFVAIDLEPQLYSSSNQPSNVTSIIAAIQALQNTYKVKPVIYASSADWQAATGNDATIGGCGSGDYCVPIWNARGDLFPDLFDDKIAGSITPWAAVGGWSGRLGKQYNLGKCFKDSSGHWHCGVPLVNGCNPRVNPNCQCQTGTTCKDAGLLDLDVSDVSLFQ